MYDKDTYTAATLIKQLGEDSQEALGGLIVLYKKSLTRLIAIYTRDHVLIEEIFLDLMQTLWEKRKFVSALNNPYTWMVKVTRNKTLNKLRTYKGRHLTDLEKAYQLPAKTDISADIDYNDLERFISLAAEKLTPREKEVFGLSIRYGWNTRAIAERLNISESTVRNQLANGLKKIRTALSGFLKTIMF
ncbi:MAG: sigma-70 family RNA polymerase sigma factor [Chitinophagaceae bacterium]